MTDEERALVGTCYKEHGQDEAIRLGHKLVSGKTKEERMAGWIEFARKHPEGYLYCFRGGLRSRTTQQWLKETGVNYPLVIGGYKALRNALLTELEQEARKLRLGQVFVLTTQTAHWFIEQGFVEASLDELPGEKQALYNLQRNSKVFFKNL